MDAEEKLERSVAGSGPARLAVTLCGKDGFGLPEKRKMALLFHVRCGHKVVCHGETDLLVFGAPKAVRHWQEAKAELIKTEFALRNCARLQQRTQPHWEKGQTPPLWQDHKCTPRCHKGSELQSGRRGIFSIILAGQTKTIKPQSSRLFFFSFWKSISLSDWTSETKSSFQLPCDFFLLLFFVGQCFSDHAQGNTGVGAPGWLSQWSVWLLISGLWVWAPHWA